MSITNIGSDRSTWTVEDETRLIQFLINHQSSLGPGVTLGTDVWNAAAEELSKHVTRGGLKTVSSCKSKWNKVCINNFFILYANDAQ